MQTRLTEQFGIRHPILSAPMALIAGGRLVAVDRLRGVPWPQEFSFGVLKNKFTDERAHREGEAALVPESLAAAYAEARAKQDLNIYLTVVGEATGLLPDRPSAATIVENMVAEAESLLARGASLDFRASRTAL